MKGRVLFVVLLVSLAMALFLIAGCGKESGTTTQEQKQEETTQKKSEETEEGKVLSVGDTATVEGAQVSVSKITTTDDLASPEANALLLTGEEGEGANRS
ncbi:MAG: hypothetical protein HPY75_00075 [Actinobacteria bacterium]|nr:hypothetical protein [Actinomycetota bacterium]